MCVCVCVCVCVCLCVFKIACVLNHICVCKWVHVCVESQEREKHPFRSNGNPGSMSKDWMCVGDK